MKIDLLRLGGLRRRRRVGKDAQDPLARDQHIHMGPRGRAGPVDQHAVAVEHQVAGLWRREGRWGTGAGQGAHQR